MLGEWQEQQPALPPGQSKDVLCEEAPADVNMNVLCVETGSALLLQMDTTE